MSTNASKKVLATAASQSLQDLQKKDDEAETTEIFGKLLNSMTLGEDDHQTLLRLLGKQPLMSPENLTQLSQVLVKLCSETTWRLSNMTDEASVVKEEIAFHLAIVAAFGSTLPRLPEASQRYHGHMTKLLEAMSRFLEALSDILQFPDPKTFLADDKGGRRSNFLIRSVAEFEGVLDGLTDKQTDKAVLDSIKVWASHVPCN